MKRIVGYKLITSKKNGQDYISLHMLDDEFVRTEKAVGNMVSSVMLSEEVQFVGEIKIGARVRVFKEEDNGVDKVRMVHVLRDDEVVEEDVAKKLFDNISIDDGFVDDALIPDKRQADEGPADIKSDGKKNK